MIFCGQCGLQLSPGSTRCPRCGATIEGTSTGVVDDMHPDDATTASPAFIPPNQPGTLLPNGQQPLVLRSGMDNGNYNYGTGTPETYDATSRVEAPNFNTRMPSNQNMQTAYPGQGYNQGGLYPTQAAYPEYGIQNAGSYPGQGGNYPGQGINSAAGRRLCITSQPVPTTTTIFAGGQSRERACRGHGHHPDRPAHGTYGGHPLCLAGNLQCKQFNKQC